MAITFVAAGASGKAASGNVTPGTPAGISNNDILVLVIASRDNIDSSVDNGFTQKNQDGDGSLNRMEVWYKRTTGSEGTTTVTHTGGNSIIARMYAFSGCTLNADPFNATGTGTVQDGSSTTFTTNSVSTTVANCMILNSFMSQDDNTWGTYSGAATLEAGQDSTTLGNDNSAGVTYGLFTGTGAAGTSVAVQTVNGPDAGFSQQFALEPLPAAGVSFLTLLGVG